MSLPRKELKTLWMSSGVRGEITSGVVHVVGGVPLCGGGKDSGPSEGGGVDDLFVSDFFQSHH